MSNAFLSRAAAALAVLLVLWGGLSLWRRAGRDQAGTFALPAIDSAAVDGIVLARATDTIRLTRTGGDWTVAGFRANGALVRELLGGLADTASRSELVAESPSSHARLGIDSASARRIAFTRGDQEMAALLVGNRGGSWETAYLRAPGSDAVYQVRGRWVEWAERSGDDWRDKRILAIEPDSVAAVSVTTGRSTWTLSRNGTTWTIGGAPTDSAAVVNFLAQFRALDAAGFATPAQADSADFSAPDRAVVLTAAGNRRLASLVIDSTAAGLLMRREGEATVFRIEAWIANQLTPRDSTLRKRQ